MKTKMKILYKAGLLSVACIILSPELNAATSMADALKKMVEENPQIKGDTASAKAREHLIDQARSGYFPKIDASLSAGWERTRNKFWTTSCASALNCKARKFRSNPSIDVVQNIFDGFKTTAQVEKARADYIQGEKKVDETMELLAFRTANAYIDVRRFQRLLREAKRNHQAHKAIAGKVEELIKAGRASTKDRYTMQARTATAANAITDIQGDLDTAVAQYKNLTGQDPDNLVSARIREEYIPKCLSDALRVGLDNNKTVILARSRIDVTTAEMKNRQGAYFPTFDLQANVNRAKNNGGKKGYTDVYNVLGVVRYNLYNGGADMARSSEVAELLAEQRFRLDSDLRTAEEDIRKSWAQYKSSEASSVEVRKSVTALKQEKEAFEKLYELGEISLTDVLGSVNQYFLARGSLITTDAAIDISQARLLASMGVLLERYGFKRNSPQIMSDEGRTDLKDTSYSNKSCGEEKRITDKQIEAEKDALLKETASTESDINLELTPTETTPATTEISEAASVSTEENTTSSGWFSDLFSAQEQSTTNAEFTADETPTAAQPTSFSATAETASVTLEEESSLSNWFSDMFSPEGTSAPTSEFTIDETDALTQPTTYTQE